MKYAKSFLIFCSWLFHAAILIRHFLYDRKIFIKKFAPLPVVSVGNVTAGGTGKTQTILLLAEFLAQEFRVAILSRGYRSKSESAKIPLLVDYKKHESTVCGDEPLMLAKRLSHVGSVFVVVNKNRFQSALQAQELGAQVLLLDDGMQHRRLHRNFEIVVIDGQTSFGDFLPKGRLREDLRRLKTVDLILFIGFPDPVIEQQVVSMTCAPCVVAHIAPVGFFDVAGVPIGSIAGKKIGVFCGIGNPARFVKSLNALGAMVVSTHFSADHCIMNEKNLDKFATFSKQKGADMLLCTEKDKVKLSNAKFSLPIVWMKVALNIKKNQGIWEKAINEIKILSGGKL